VSALRLAAVLTLVIGSPAFAEDVTAGPEVGKSVPALKVFAITGPHEGKDVDYADDRKDKPTVYLLVNAEKWDRPVARFVRELDLAADKFGKDARVVAVWVHGDADKAKEYLPLVQKSLKMYVTDLTAFTGDKAGPDGWAANTDAHLTAVVAANGKVAAVFGYRSVNETDVPKVIAALEKAAKGK
jgi:hypothetical protein